MTTHPMHSSRTTAQPSRRTFEQRLQRGGEFLFNQWATIITTLLGVIVFAALSVPFLSYLGLDVIAKPIFYSLHYLCAQIPSHSFYVFGHQLGMCARNFSIYTSMFLGSLLFVLTKKRLPGLPWYFWILFLIPMALDGFSQMFGLRESTWELRVLTGTLFGLGNVWFVLPLMHKMLLETTPPVPYPSRPPYHQPVQQAVWLQQPAQHHVPETFDVIHPQENEQQPSIQNKQNTL